MDAVVRVTIKRGLYIRQWPEFLRGNEVAELKFGQTYHITSTTKISGWTWGKGDRGWIPLANGRNLKVEQVQGNPLPL